jgi:glutamate dehydrogenase/leucine dehydrogenase
VIPITEDYGLWHPQEGIVNGHFNATEPQKIKKLGQLRQGVVKVLEDPHYSPSTARKYTVADMITGYGVAESVCHFYNIWGGQYQGKRAIVQGWGNVGASAAYYLAAKGVKIVTALFLNRQGNTLNPVGLLPFEEVNNRIWSLPAEICIPAAASRLISRAQVEQMISNGMEVISSGANVPFQDSEIFFGPTGEFADRNLAVIPDFVANCGMARVFAYLMESEVEITDEAIFTDVSTVIRTALEKAHEKRAQKTEIAKTCFEIALSQLL